MSESRHGFLLLFPHDGTKPSRQETYDALMDLGFGPFDKEGKPAFVVLSNHSSKAQYMEAGFWMGLGIPLLVCGAGLSVKHRQAAEAARMGGWVVNVESIAEIVDAVLRRKIKPTEWDRDRIISCLTSMATKGIIK